MSAPPELPPSKGKDLIAAYRAARLRQRPVLRTTLHQSHVARRAARTGAVACQQEPEPQAPAEPPPPPPPVPETADLASVFASLVNFSNEPDEPPGALAGKLPEALAGEPQERSEAPAGAYDPPLAEIGFGPGMLIRLSQLGVHSTGDLAHADASVLRAALGDISRLVDVEAWIASARQSVAGGTEIKRNAVA